MQAPGPLLCRLNTKNAQSAFEEGVWLDLADDWTRLAEGFDHEEQPS
jgi:hypothetical protein